MNMTSDLLVATWLGQNVVTGLKLELFYGP